MTGRPLIFSTHGLHPDITRQLCDIGDLRIATEPTQKAIAEESTGANYVVVRAKIDPEIVVRETQLRALVRHGAGLDMIPVDTCTKTGVLVANVPGVNALTVAEHVIWTSLALMRRYPNVNTDLRTKNWESGRAHSNNGIELTGKTVGIIGFGNVGRAVGRILSTAFDSTILTVTRSPADLPDYVKAVSFGELLRGSDVVVLSCPLNDQTEGMMNDDAFAQVKQGAILINVARGPVIVEAALLEALREGKLSGAALDVFDEQPLPPDHPLFSFDNVILTPHMAGITDESMLRMGQGVVDAIRQIHAGKLPESFINPEALNLYKSRFDEAPG